MGALAGRPVAVYTDAEDIDSSAGMQLLRDAGFEVRFLQSQDPDVIAAQAHDAEVLLVGYAPVSAQLMDRLPNLKMISLISMGFDNVDLDAATSRGIWVSNLPGVATEEVATHALALTLALIRNIPFYERSLPAGGWLDQPAVIPPRLSETTLGVVGLGRIGLTFARMASRVFGEVVGYDPLLPDTEETRRRLAEAGVRRTGLDDVIRGARVISLHVPLTPETRHLINEQTIALMQPGSFVVNVSRGQLIDSAALSAAIASGRLAGAALDVLDTEPAGAEHPLIGAGPEIIVTPHVAFLSDWTLREYVRLQAEHVLEWFRDGRPSQPVNTLHPQR
jgi:D-3-phosphoglycerate dehydrogenase